MRNKTRQRLELVREFLDQYAKLRRRDTDEARWIALKLRCSLREADNFIRGVRKLERSLLETSPSPLTVKMIFVSGMTAGIDALRARKPSDTEVEIAVAKARELDAESKDYEGYFG